MSIEITCDACFQSFRVGDDKAGKVVKCKECGERIKVPSAEGDDFGADDFEEESAPRRQTKAPRAGSKAKSRPSNSDSNSNVALIAGGAAVVLLLVGGGLFLLMRGGPAEQPVVVDAGAVNPAVAAPAAGAAPAPASPVDVAKTVAPPTANVPPAPAAANPAAPAPALAPRNAPAADVGGWKVTADPAAQVVDWPDKVDVSIPVPGRGDELYYPTSPSPFVAVGFEHYESDGAQMWNLVTGEQFGEIRGSPSKQTKRAVSQDGKYLAVHVLDNDIRTRVEFWSFETGQIVKAIQCDEPKFQLSIMDFAGPDQFFTYTFGQGEGGKFWHRFKIWDVPSGGMVRQMEVSGSEINQYHYAFSPGKRYFATAETSGKLFIYDLQTGVLAGKAIIPTASDIEPHLMTQSLTFTSDGKKLVLLNDGPKETRIVHFDMQTGKRNPDDDISFPGRLLSAIANSASYKGPKLACLPRDAGYLISGDVWVDGPSGRIVWYIDRSADQYNHTQRCPVPNGVIIPEGPDKNKRLAVVEVPWSDVQDTLKAIDDEKKAKIRPGMAVSIEVQVGKLQHGDPEKTKAALIEVLTERLAAEGIEVKEGESTTLKVSYQEAAGQTLSESTGNPLNPLRGGTPTGRSVQATQAGVNVSWSEAGSKKPFWTKVINVDPRFLIFQGEATAEKARDSMFEGLKNTLFAQPLPYFVPEGKELVQLPGFTELRNPVASANSRTKMRLDAAKKKKKK